MDSLHKRLREKTGRFWTRDSETGDWFRRFGRPALVAYLVLFTLYQVTTRLGLVTGMNAYGLMAGYIIAQLFLGSIFLVAMIRVYGRSYVAFFLGVLVIGTVISYAYLTVYY